MTLSPGVRLASYEILGPIGAGGMGQVYRARDTKLQRTVAIKILPDLFATDPDRLARFEREAQALAALNHQNIAQVHGVLEGPPAAIVMEFVDGEDLAERLARGPVPLEEALPIARQIAEALEAAHERGIIHRDLKPANIRVRADGSVKVLDFGLAKALGPESTHPDEKDAALDAMNSPTFTSPAITQMGVILGTAAYMAPEQAKGRPIDKRVDIWAFGVLLFELLTGRSLYAADTVAETIARIIERAPDLSALPPSTAAGVRALLARCLERDPRQRLRDIGEARIALERPGPAAHPARAGPSTPAGRRRTFAWLAAVAAAALAAGMLAWFIRAPADMPVRRFSLQPPGEGSVFSAVLSPTGNAMALIVDDRVWLQKLDAFEASVVPASDGARAVFWSPDGAFVGFQARGQLWKTATAGGQPIAIGRVPQDFTSAGGAAWIDDRIVFTSGGTGLFEMPAEGGEARLLVEVDPAQETDLHNAAALPDSRGVLFISHLLRGAGRGWRLDLATPEDGAPKALLSARRPLFTAPEPIFNPAYSPSGHVLFQQGADVWALPFSLSSLSVTGEPFRLASNARNASADAAGTLVMVSGGGLGANLQLVWIDRTRRVTPASRQTMASANFPRISPDGRFAAAVDAVGDAGDIWIIDLERGTDRRLTFEPGGDTVPAWTPDGQFIVYQCDSAGDEAVPTICARRADGGGARVELLKGVRGAPTLSPDGRFLLFTRESDLWIVEIGKSGFSVPLEAEPRRLIAANRDQRYAEVSPDGRFVAYESSEGGTWKVFVTRFPSGEGKWEIPGGYAAWPRWSPKGDRLYVADDAQHIVEIEVDLKTTFSAGARIVRIPAGVFPGSGFDRAPDGSRFLVGQPQSDVGRRSSILVVQNWRAER